MEEVSINIDIKTTANPKVFFVGEAITTGRMEYRAALLAAARAEVEAEVERRFPKKVQE